MQLPPWVYAGRSAIEGLIPRDGAANAVVHITPGLAVAGGTVAYSTRLPDEADATPDQRSQTDLLMKATKGMAFGAAPLFLTAGMMLNTTTNQALKRGVTANYFLAAGAVLGAAFVTYPAYKALSN